MQDNGQENVLAVWYPGEMQGPCVLIVKGKEPCFKHKHSNPSTNKHL